MVEELRKELLDSIIKYGIVDNRTYEVSKKLDKAINEYYQNNKKDKKNSNRQ